MTMYTFAQTYLPYSGYYATSESHDEQQDETIPTENEDELGGAYLRQLATQEMYARENDSDNHILPNMTPKGYLLQFLSFFWGGGVQYPLLSLVNRLHEPHALSVATSCGSESKSISHTLLNLPMASAKPHHYRHKKADWDEHLKILTVENESVKADVFSTLKTYMVNKNILDVQQGETFEFEWRNAAAGTFLYVYTDEGSNATAVDALRRVKRVNANEYIANHIMANCAFEEEIYNAEGENVGKQLIVQAQNIEDPLRLIFGDMTEQNASGFKKFAVDGSRMVFLILTTGLTFGLMPAAQRIYASVLRKKYYQAQGDRICADRQNHLILANIATSLMVEGRPYKSRASVNPKPAQIHPEVWHSNRAALYTRDKSTHIEREVLVKVKSNAPAEGRGQTETFIVPAKDGTARLSSAATDKNVNAGRKVFLEKKKNEWHYVDDPSGAALNVEVSEGNQYIQMGDKKYQLHTQNAAAEPSTRYSVVIDNAAGNVEYQPVYREPITKRWHFLHRNERVVFTKRQTKVIESNELTPEQYEGHVLFRREGGDPQRYGDGEVYDIRKIGDSVSSPPVCSVVEIYGRLVKIEIIEMPGKGPQYVVKSKAKNGEKMFPLAWEDQRWTLERIIPLSMPKKLAERITVKMQDVQVETNTLSLPDARELRWDAHRQPFLLIKGKYYNLRASRLDQNVYTLRNKNDRLNLVYRDKQYHEETLGERLQRLKTIGLSGRGTPVAARNRGQREPVEVIQDVFGMDKQDARTYLGQYRFEKKGLYNEREFVRYIEQYECIPQWAERFKINDAFSAATALSKSLNIEIGVARQYLKQYRFEKSGPHSETEFVSYVSQYKALPHWAEPYRLKGIMEHLGDVPPLQPGVNGKKIDLGVEIGQGLYGVTYMDARDPQFVIKRLKPFSEVYSSASDTLSENTISLGSSSSSSSTEDLWNSALDEADLFQRYYGVGTAEAIVEDELVYIRMRKVPGIPLFAVENGGFASDAVERFVDMLERLAERGILHMDLHDGNILYHENEFYPIDFSSNYDSYFYRMAAQGKAEDNTNTHNQFESIVSNIRAKQYHKDSELPPQR